MKEKPLALLRLVFAEIELIRLKAQAPDEPDPPTEQNTSSTNPPSAGFFMEKKA